MMHSYLITGGSQEERIKKEQNLCQTWNVQSHDIIRLGLEKEKQSIGIEQIRIFIQNLSLSPRASPLVVGVVDTAEHLTLEAQNALLKILEEPPPKARIILETENGTLLIPTISSRCQTIHVPSSTTISLETYEAVLKTLTAFHGKKPGEIVALVSQHFGEKEEGIRFLDTLLILCHEHLCSTQQKMNSTMPFPWTEKSLPTTIRHILHTQKLLSSHVQTLLVFDHFFLTSMLDKH